MKSNLIKILILSVVTLLSSCAIEPYEGTIPAPNQSPTTNPSQAPQYAMTAKINGVQFKANNPFGSNLFSSTNLLDYYPLEDFVLLQGRKGGVLGNPEINLWLKRSDIAVGVYPIEMETYDTPPSHFIDLIDNSNDFLESTKEGTITITEVNTTTKTVKGTFEFTTIESIHDPNPVVNCTVTNGTFNYKYMN